MNFLEICSLTPDLLPAALELDQRCFGGLWTLDGYRRELESPNSELFVLLKAKERNEETRDRRQETGDKGIESTGKAGLDFFGRSQETKLIQNTLREGQSPTKLGISPAETLCEREQNLELKISPTEAHRVGEASPKKLRNSSSPLLGLGCYWAILEEAHITILGIDPEYQQQGLGQALFYAMLHSACLRGLERATLEVRPSNQTALSLYQKFGFREAGRRKRYYQDTGEDALVLWKGGLQSEDFSQLLCTQWNEICDRLYRSAWQPSTGWTHANVKK